MKTGPLRTPIQDLEALLPNLEGNLAQGLIRSAVRSPGEPALELPGRSVSYGELAASAVGLAGLLSGRGGGGPVAICATKGIGAFAAVAGTLIAGRPFVPLSLGDPAARVREILRATGCEVALVDRAGAELLGEAAGSGEGPELVPVDGPDASGVGEAIGHGPPSHFSDCGAEGVSGEALAFVLCTSGSTGVPKAVAISHRAYRAMVERMVARYGVGPGDRIAQIPELTSDGALVDTFLAWETGATLCCPEPRFALRAEPFLQSVSMVHLTPSTALLVQRMGSLVEGQYPDLRYVLFGGEALPYGLAAAVAHAAPNAELDNIYGATEYSIFSIYRIPGPGSPDGRAGDIVPLGSPLDGGRFVVLGPDGCEVPAGTVGDMAVAGPQLFSGYLGGSDAGREVFVSTPRDPDRTFYRTGDRVYLEEESGLIRFVGRSAHLLKIDGILVDTGEIEHALGSLVPGAEVAAVGWPVLPTGCGGIVAFVAGGGGPGGELRALRQELRARLPRAFVPREIHRLESLPRTRNGKIDRQALRGILDAPAAPGERVQHIG